MPTPSRDELKPAVKRFNRWQFIEAQTMLKELSAHSEGSDANYLMALADIAGGFAKIWHKGGEPHAMVSLLRSRLRSNSGVRAIATCTWTSRASTRRFEPAWKRPSGGGGATKRSSIGT